MPPRSNRLANESSAYLKAHAHDPVDWMPWGTKAFAEARSLDRPIFLSIGYQSCHWCHVMQRESFRDTDTAKMINSGFVPIKVDREIRPDVDALYSLYLQLSTGSGGWPMSIFLTPDGLPFFGGTYFPASAQLEGRLSFRSLMDLVRSSWVLSREKTTAVADESFELLQPTPPRDDEHIGREILDHLASSLLQAEDHEHGGFGDAPKFPQAPLASFLVEYAVLSEEAGHASAALRSTLAMLRGGIYDQAGGGLFRYSTDEFWLVPHFEKMLYDQGLLLSTLSSLAPFASDGEREELAFYARATAEHLHRDLTCPDGGYFSATDAEASGVEGEPYVWTYDGLGECLDDRQLELAQRYLGVHPNGNWKSDFTILTRRGGRAMEGDDARDVDSLLDLLRSAREARPQPQVIENRIVSWNALVARGLLQAGAAFEDPALLDAGLECVDWLESAAVWHSRDVLHAIGDRSVSKIRFLEDTAAVVSAMCTAAEHAGWKPGVKRARKLHDASIERFSRDGLFVMSTGETALPCEVIERYDNPTPSGVAMLAHNALDIARLEGAAPGSDAHEQARETANAALRQVARAAHSVPALTGHALAVQARLLGR